MPLASNLSAILSRWCQTNGLYAKQTFISLFTCLIRMVREHRMAGLVITYAGDGFEGLTDGLSTIPDVTHTELTEDNLGNHSLLPGMLIILTDRLCCLLYWRPDTEPTFQLYEGGWTFHPAEVRHVAEQILSSLKPATLSSRLLEQMGNTTLDRRYDDRLSTFIPALVQGLEQRNRELTLALKELQTLHDRMVQAERLAAIGQVSATIAHEIRNPLGLIDLYGKLVENEIAETDCTEADKQRLMAPLRHIQGATCHLESFLSELTDYSKPFQINATTTRVWDLLEQVVAFCQPLAHQWQCQLQLVDNAGQKNLLANVDGPRLQQALLNVIKNALEITPAGGQVQVSLASRKQDDHLFIKITDQGPGIQKPQQAKLFTPFFTTKSQGTGLGLARSQKIMQAHGGCIKLLSSSAKGSTFALAIPKGRVVAS
jgi:signal transduction histidine kinase